MKLGPRVPYPPVKRTEIDGVPVVWADLPGPFLASLMFRVGRADETLANSGITHLVEHVVLPGEFHDDYDHNGTVDQTRTVLFARGEPEEVGRFLTDVCARFERLPLEALAQEVNVLFTEEATSGPNPIGDLNTVRFGGRGFGLVGHGQVGLHRLTPAELEEWSRRFFTRGNAILILSGPPPAGLRLPLRDGSRVPAPDPSPLERSGRVWFESLNGMVALSLTGPRETGLGLGLRIAARRVHDQLRRGRGLTYSADVADERLGREAVHHVLLADCMDQHATAVRDGVLAAVEQVATEGPTDAEVRADWASFMREIEDPAAAFGWLDLVAEMDLLGVEVGTQAQYLERAARIGPDEARSALATALDTAILLVPEGVGGPHGAWSPVVRLDGPPVTGRTYHRGGFARVTSGERLIVGEEGVSLLAGGRWHTVRWAEAELLMHLKPGGVLMVFDGSGAGIELELAGWQRPGHIVADLSRRVPERMRVIVDEPPPDHSQT